MGAAAKKQVDAKSSYYMEIIEWSLLEKLQVWSWSSNPGGRGHLVLSVQKTPPLGIIITR